MAELRVPKLNNNDTEYVLLEWLAEDGAEVRKGDPVVVLETSKAAEELPSEATGLLRRLLPEGAACVPGQALARVVGSPDEITMADPEPEPEADGPVITAPAQALMDEHGIDLDKVRALGLQLVRRSDIEQLIDAGATGPRTEPLPPHQRAVAATVERSHRTIPAAFTAIKVDAGPALARAKALTRELRALVGLPELLVQAVAGLHERFPMCFAELVDGHSVRYAEAPHVGVTFDAGSGLYVPVVRDAAKSSLKEIAESLMRFRMTALRGSFTEAELSGGNIVVALNNDADALIAVPIVYPGQACAVSLCAPQEELVPAGDGQIARRTAVTLGLAYDHRLINGREALQFLHGLRDALEGDPG